MENAHARTPSKPTRRPADRTRGSVRQPQIRGRERVSALPTVTHRQPDLPTEVIQHIFAVFSAPLSTFDLRQFPWFLGHICSTWRRIFLSMTVEFWDSISVFFFERRYKTPIEVIRFFLERDPEAPFSLHAHSPYDLSQGNQRAADYIHRAMKMLVNKSIRWRKASFELSRKDLLPLARAKDRLPLLQKIDLQTQWVGDEGMPDPPYEVFQNAPSLNTVQIGNLSHWKFNLLNLKEFCVGALGSGAFNFVTTLPQMTKLERLELGRAPDPSILSHAIILPNLVVLSCYVDWLRYLQTPALEDLFIDYFEGSNSSDVVSSFLHNSSCGSKIRRLSMSLTGAATALDIIRCTPHITYLHLISIRDIGGLFRQLTVSTHPAQEPLARRLLSFSLYIYDPDIDKMDLLFDLISSRTVLGTSDNGKCAKLQEVEVGGFLDNASGSVKKIATLCKERGVRYGCIEI